MIADPCESPKVVDLTQHCWAWQAVDNMGWADLGDWALIVDALEQTRFEQPVLDALGETLDGKEVRYVLNTHTHYDHVALNRTFEREFGAQVIHRKNTEIDEGGMWFDGGQRRAQMFAIPGCHTDEDCAVWLPEEKVLFVGDVFGWGLIPPNGPLRPETHRRILQTYEKLIDLEPDHVVPGHGPACTAEELRRWLKYYRWLHERVAEAVQEGRKDHEILDLVPPPQDMIDWWRFVEWKHEDATKKMTDAVRNGV